MYLRELASFLVHHILFSLIQAFHINKYLAAQYQFTSRRASNKKRDKMLKAGVLKPVHEATPWINSFVLVEGKDKFVA